MGDDLRFDRAAYAPGAEGEANDTGCGSCAKPLGGEYWTWNTRVLCASCRAAAEALVADAQSAKSFGKAVALGGGAALACGVAYAVFVGLSHVRLSLITIGIAFVVAKVVRHASRGVGGPRFQVLAVALTYVASSMGYAPDLFDGIRSASDRAEVQQTAHAPAGSAAPATAPEVDAAEPPPSLAFSVVFLFGIMLAAPFLTFSASPMGVAIVLFGLWEAWKLSRGVPFAIAGPYRVAPPPVGPYRATTPADAPLAAP